MSEIITFYSYKGGVGRTMALANVSILLAKWGHKVLVVDWDLEAPGLEHYYKDFIEDTKIVDTTHGVIDLLQLNPNINWQDTIIPIKTNQSEIPIDFISSGKRDEDYFNKVRSFDVNTYYENNGGDEIEKLRNEWLANYDYILIDSRTGITEIGGICTIQLPDTLVMLFTATNQGFEGVLDIIKRAGTAQQKLSYDRQKLIYLPVPSKFDANSEYEHAQKWLKIFEKGLENVYYDWLPASINRKEFLELTKIPYVPYFSFGETLPVIEQGVKDPSGLGYAYESIAALIANHLNNVDMLYNNRDEYIANVNKNPSAEIEIKRNGNGKEIATRLGRLKQKMDISDDAIKVEKSEMIVIDCIEKSIFPLLKLVSAQMKDIGSFFKNKNEKVQIVGKYSKTSVSKDEIFISATLTDLITNIRILYKTVNEFDFEGLIYSVNFTHLRKSKNINFRLPINILILFHETVYEVKSFEEYVYMDKLYHQVLTDEDLEAIVNEICATLPEKIEFAINEQNPPAITSAS